MRCAEALIEIGLLDPGVGFVECFEFPRKGFEHIAHTRIGTGGLILARLAPVAFDCIMFDLGFMVCDRGAGQRHVAV